MNRLQHETSPYLLQHAGNPVDWYAWKPEAFQKAQAENKPILVSIGYSTCHWCHVMERESFENESVAAFMNDHFVNIKVDREERPDIDQIYMEVCQAITGSGGWPLNCFLLPDRRPFYAGTYFPPHAIHNRPSWLQLLQRIQRMYTNKYEVLVDQAGKLMEVLEQSEKAVIQGEAITEDAPDQSPSEDLNPIYEKYQQEMDQDAGGFGGAPKFPLTMSLRWLLEYHYHTGHKRALQHVDFSLERMIRGGIYDQLGGGFARYATDKNWLIPHFEKMLYDNALLISLLADRFSLQPNDTFRWAIEHTLEWVERDMQHPDQGFYSALDADSEGEEGKFYVWTKQEIEALLPENAPLFLHHYGVQEGGNWEGKSILWQPYTLAQTAGTFSLDQSEVARILGESRQKLLAHREKRVRPGLDDKQLLSWNALMITAYAKSGRALDRSDYLDRAQQKMDFLQSTFAKSDGSFAHSWKEGQPFFHAFLDDYAALIEALIHLYQATFHTNYIRKAADLCDYVRLHFLEEATGLFYFTPSGQEDAPVRKKDLYDSAVPSGNATMCWNLWMIGRIFDRGDYLDQSWRMVRQVKSAAQRFPTSFARWARCLMAWSYPGPEVAVVGPNWREVTRELGQSYWPNRLVMGAAGKGAETAEDSKFPLLRGRASDQEQTNIFVCQNYTCQLPVQDVETARQLIQRGRINSGT